MTEAYQTLSIIYNIVKSDPAPHTYLCTPHEIILRQTEDWKSIQKHLESLAAEQLIIIKQLDKIAISITAAGIAKAKALKNNFVNKDFVLGEEKPSKLNEPK
jgi:predicted transcriptional regulator